MGRASLVHLVTSRPSSALNCKPLLWLLWCASLLLVLSAWARLAPEAYFASGYEPSAAGAELSRSDEAGINDRQLSLRLDQHAVLATGKLKRQSHPKRLLDALGANAASWGAAVSVEESESALSASRVAARAAPIRKRVPRMGTDEPPWPASRSRSRRGFIDA